MPRPDVIRTVLRPAWTDRQAETFLNRLTCLGWQAVECDEESVVMLQPVSARRCIVTRFDRERSARPMLTLTSEDRDVVADDPADHRDLPHADRL